MTLISYKDLKTTLRFIVSIVVSCLPLERPDLRLLFQFGYIEGVCCWIGRTSLAVMFILIRHFFCGGIGATSIENEVGLKRRSTLRAPGAS